MLHQDGADPIAALRDAIARIETCSGFARRRSSATRPRDPLVRLGGGSLRLDAVLGGGLRRKTLHEIVAAHRQDDGGAAGFAAALALRCAGTGAFVWIQEDSAAFETGSPYRPGLIGHGLDADRLVLVRTRDAAMTLWAMEEALRLKAGTVLAELWGSRHYGLAPSRRLLLAAQAGGGTALLLHTGLSGHAAALSSAAETRLSVAACPSPHLASAGHRLPIPGPPAFAVRLLKHRLGARQELDGDPFETRQGFDSDETHGLVWNAAHRCFDDHPIPFGVSAAPADRPAPAADADVRRLVRRA